MIIFFDLGINGGVSVFEKNKLKKHFIYCLSKNKTMPVKSKMKAFEEFLNKKFDKPELYKIVGSYEPFGKNFKTVMNLSFLIALIIRHFKYSNHYLLNEWTVWRDVLKISKIPVRQEKKEKTVEWVNQKFKIQVKNNDEADAILGAFYLQNYFLKINLYTSK